MSNSSPDTPSLFSRLEEDLYSEESPVTEATSTKGSTSASVEPEEKAVYDYQPISILAPGLSLPISIYQTPHFTPSKERYALDELLSQESNQTYGNTEFVGLVLDEFTIYRGNSGHGLKDGMVSLHDVAKKQGGSVFYFDGRLSCGNSQEFFLQRVPFSPVSIGGYEDISSIRSTIWIQSTHCQQRGGEIWYQLSKPSSEYKPYYHLSCWVADLAKHFVDYLYEHENVTLDQFKTNFYDWLCTLYKDDDKEFSPWLLEYANQDFRHAIIAHADFLQKQAFNLDSSYANHAIWDEIGLSETPIVPKQPSKVEKTVVTPFIYNCFRNMDWASHLKMVEISPKVLAQRQSIIKEHERRLDNIELSSRLDLTISEHGDVAIGDVIAVQREDSMIWKGQDDAWYALVQGISESGRISLIWLYRPTDTICANLTYPYSNELFLSDHCNCDEAIVTIKDVTKKVPVSFLVAQAECLFVRQTYHVSDQTFTTLVQSDFTCNCTAKTTMQYAIGDTVLVSVSGRLEPAEIVELENDNVAKVRVFLRRARDFKDQTCRPNELVYTDNLRSINFRQIKRKCHIRFYSEGQHIPAPYNRDGNGDAFYVTSCKNIDGLTPMVAPDGFRLGFDPGATFSKLRALNLFSGGGTFDRGLEEGGAIHSEWAVEWGLPQMLTYRANHQTPDQLKLFCGSVNDYLLQAIHGSTEHLIAQVGEVQVISGGSPCQGYSTVNSWKQSEESQRNCSMIASVAAYVDLYRPEYAILENVTSMANKILKKNPLSQLLCAFVGMGYQARLLNLDAWSFGAPQSRSRLFILIAAPGLTLPERPPLTHSHPDIRNRALGEAPNGLPFGQRHWETPVFKFVSASEAVEDLPSINTARIMSIPYPDHRPSRVESAERQVVVNLIPKNPYGMGLIDAIARGRLDGRDFPSRLKVQSKAWSRINPMKLFPTVTTSITPFCKFTGRWLHWQENRIITIMEARRAQGYPDSEVLVGRPSDQWKIVGNSVARQVAVALGLSIRAACLQNHKKGMVLNNAPVPKFQRPVSVVVEHRPTKRIKVLSHITVPEIVVADRVPCQ
ncbi:DNA methyltransferase Dim-2 [Myotisia sp. PD_48]|nr:DNA methyltransferase Dim-2 [Myotisia sp. PD_48]